MTTILKNGNKEIKKVLLDPRGYDVEIVHMNFFNLLTTRKHMKWYNANLDVAESFESQAMEYMGNTIMY